jgi:oxygen-independent coproporphyrinogen-3 oxidase
MSAGVYLHIPFCKSRCSYCDFATDIYRSSKVVERYVSALCSEIRGSDTQARNVDTIYFGGGTPSLLTSSQVEKILTTVDAHFAVQTGSEITMEMNPATVTPETLRDFRSLGVNRASFGVQTFNDRALRLLARGHDANDARQTYGMLRESGFENISFDLIAGLPGQRIEDWEQNLDEATQMSPEHLSLYLLEIHNGTPLAEQVRSGRQPEPDESLAARMYEVMCERLAATGYEQYEISNFARPGFESRHNTKYWLLEPVYGFGVSAHSLDGFQRYSNGRDTAKYVEHIERSGTAEATRETINAASEYVFLGMRLERGIDLDEYFKRFEIDLEGTYGSDLERLQNEGLVEIRENILKLTQKGKLFSNEVFEIFV